MVATQTAPDAAQGHRDSRRDHGHARLWDSLVLAVLAFVVLLQSPGRTRFDTKLDLTVDPWGFLSRAFAAWDPSSGFGQIQNQAYGYLWPMGPYFGVLHSLNIPAWVIQATWAWGVLALAYVGVRVLATRLGFGWGPAACAGLAYALAPRMVTVIGPLSAEALPAALLPFTLIPAAAASGRTLRTAFLTALPVLMMGAANAALTLVTLPVTALWLLLRVDAGRVRLLLAWAGFIAAFTAWWIVPLLVQARYASPFLSYIESAADTAGGLNPFDVLRGQVHWVAGIVDAGQPWWPAGFQYVGEPALVALTAGVAGLGVIGLSLGRMPARRALILSALLGWVVLLAGSTSAMMRDAWLPLLDGPLVPFRNVHKFDPLLRLPLALGLAATVATVSAWLDLRAARWHPPADWPRRAWVAGCAGAVALAAAPLVSPGVTAGRTWAAIPSWWHEAAAWTAREVPQGRTLVVPGSGFGQYLWGRTIDEPLQPLASSPWAIDNGLPMGSPGSQRVLDSISAALRSGRPAAGLADTLARSGIAAVLVRNDLDTGATRAPARARVAATLQSSEGFARVATFAEVGVRGDGLITADFGRDGPRPALEIYRVLRPVARAQAIPLDQVVPMTGGPESLLQATAAGLLPGDAPAVFVEDGLPAGAPITPLITDGLTRRERALGRGDDSMSAVLRSDEASRVARREADIVPFPQASRTVATHREVLRVDASTSAAFADAVGPIRPAQQPAAALDGDLATWWQSSALDGPTGQWLEVQLRHPADMRGLTVALAQSNLIGSRVTTVDLSTERGTTALRVSDQGRVGPVHTDLLDQVRTIRITATGAEGALGDFAIRELVLPGLHPTRPLLLPAVPDELATPRGIVLAALRPPISTCMLADGETRCDPSGQRADADNGVLDRLVEVPARVTGRLDVQAVIRSGPAAAALFDPIGRGIRVRGSSWLGGDVRVRPSAAVDGDPQTMWVADLTDAAPRLTLEWGEPRTVTSVRLESAPSGQRFAQPLQFTVRVGGRTVHSEPAGGTVVIPPTRARSLTIEVDRAWPLSSVDSITRFETRVPVAVGEVHVGGAADLVYTPELSASTGSYCGLGPELVVGGEAIPTRVPTTLGAVLRGEEVAVVPCADSGWAELGAGYHRITASPSGLASPVRLSLGSSTDRPSTARSASVTEWGTTQRAVTVGPGAAALLRIPESANDGWVATLDGVRLATSRVDGWQQAWVLPAGEGGTVVLSYTPNAWHRTGILVGAVIALLALAIGCLVPGRHGWRLAPQQPSRAAVIGPGLVLVGGLSMGLVGAALGLAGFGLGRSKRGSVGVVVLVVMAVAAWAVPGVPDPVVQALVGAGLLTAAACGLSRSER